MFLRTSQYTRGGKVYRYLKLVQSYREGKQTKQRLIATIGNLDTLEPSQIDNLIDALSKFSTRKVRSIDQLRAKRDQKYGDVLLAKHIWDELGIGKIISHYLKEQRANPDYTVAMLIMVLNRLIAPKSKLSTVEWYRKIYLPEAENAELKYQHFYRAMDYLQRAKRKIEKDIFLQLSDLFSLKVDIVFYDLTSSYFEGTECEISKFGYSRDHRSDKKQILLGLVTTKEGLPIAHEVFCGNIADKSTVEGIIKDLKSRFDIAKCIFVGDRGMVSQENLNFLEKETYQYIIALRKRQSKEIEDIIEPDLSKYQSIDDNLKALEVNRGHLRYIICHNLQKARDDRLFRQEAISQAEAKLEVIRTSFQQGRIKRQKPITIRTVKTLLKKNTFKYFDFKVSPFEYHLKQEIIAKEAILDGKYILKTNVKELSMQEIIQSYKNLSCVERAFKSIKDFLRLRPIFHYKPPRVKAHVFICVLAYLIEKVIDKKLIGHKLNLTAVRALELLDEVRLIENQLGDRTLKCITELNKTHRDIFSAIGLKRIPEAIPV